MSEEGQPPRDAHAPGQSPSQAPATLIVDDEPPVCEMMSRWLRAEGYQVHSAHCAEEALELLGRRRFDLLILDIGLPGRSGIELLSITRQQFPDMAVVMVSGVADRRTAVHALELGAYGYLAKPFEQNELIINVVSALERRRLVLASREYEQRLEAKVREQTREIRHSREEMCLRLMAALESRHGETGMHVRRIGLGADLIGKALGLGRARRELLRLAAPMHDIGKIAVPDAILLKPGKLDAREWQLMQSHTTSGAQMLAGSNIPVLDVAARIALCHHERWDGSGYPAGLVAQRIPLEARIVAIVDVYDALMHDRVYRPAMGEEAALELIQKQRSAFDPDVFESFLSLLSQLRRIREDLPDTLTASQFIAGDD